MNWLFSVLSKAFCQTSSTIQALKKGKWNSSTFKDFPYESWLQTYPKQNDGILSKVQSGFEKSLLYNIDHLLSPVICGKTERFSSQMALGIAEHNIEIFAGGKKKKKVMFRFRLPDQPHPSGATPKLLLALLFCKTEMACSTIFAAVTQLAMAYSSVFCQKRKCQGAHVWYYSVISSDVSIVEWRRGHFATSFNIYIITSNFTGLAFCTKADHLACPGR